MLLTLLPTAAFAATEVARGTVGHGGAPWRLYSDGTLVVDAGTIHWEGWWGSPWHSYRQDIQNIVFTGPIMAGASLHNLFSYLRTVVSIEGLTYFNTSNVTDMSWMFFHASSLTTLDLSSFDTSNVTDMSTMFNATRQLEVLDLSGFDTGNVTRMNSMFSRMENLTNLDLSGFDTRNVTNMGGIFADTSNLENLNLSGWDTSSVTDMSHMFLSTDRLRELVLGEQFTFLENAGLPPVPSSTIYTGYWTNGDLIATSEQLMKHYDGATMAGTWTWQRRDAVRNDLPLNDVPADSWYYPYIRYITENDIMQGSGNGNFAPNAHLTRAMFATILWRMAGEPSAADDEISLFDVGAGEWYSEAIAWAYSVGIVQGSGAGTFIPNDPITREQMAVMLFRFAALGNRDMTVSANAAWNQFTDRGDVSDWAEEAMGWAVYTGLIIGTSPTTIHPQGTATRAQCATILMRFFALG